MSAQTETDHGDREGSVTRNGTYHLVEPVLAEHEFRAMIDLCEKVGTYRMASAEMSSTEIGARLPERFECFYDLARQRGHQDRHPQKRS